MVHTTPDRTHRYDGFLVPTRTAFPSPSISLKNQLAVYTGLYGGAFLALAGSQYDQPLLKVAGAGLIVVGLEFIRETVSTRLEMRRRMTNDVLTGLDAVLAKKIF